MGSGPLAVLFVAERAHQWQSLASRDWSFSWEGRPVPRRTVVTLALAIAWGEGLGFYVASERAFWAMIFWVYAAHVLLTALLAIRAGGRARRLLAPPAVLALGALVAGLDDGGLLPASWLGSAAASAPWGPLAGGAALPVAGIVLGHAVPCFAWNLLRLPRGRRFTGILAVLAAVAEWQIVAGLAWFPEGCVFPDVPDWARFGGGLRFTILPLWMAPFLAHVALDAIRIWRPEGASP